VRQGQVIRYMTPWSMCMHSAAFAFDILNPVTLEVNSIMTRAATSPLWLDDPVPQARAARVFLEMKLVSGTVNF